MKQWYRFPGDDAIIWEWDSETQQGTWFTSTGQVFGPSLLDESYVDPRYRVVPNWTYPPELRLPEGL